MKQTVKMMQLKASKTVSFFDMFDNMKKLRTTLHSSQCLASTLAIKERHCCYAFPLWPMFKK